ncbi:coproporphyrinogen dehydrogenase HemZ [Syntrophomonas erecta]
MIIALDFRPQELYKWLHELVRMAFPGDEISRQVNGQENLIIQVSMNQQDRRVRFCGAINEQSLVKEYRLLELPTGEAHEINRLARRFTFELLSHYTNSPVSPYGILTGVRPVKLVRRLIEQGLSDEQVLQQLKDSFCLHIDKAKLLLEVAHLNHPYLLNKREAHRLISLYVGIPFCPSRCLYCSFPGAVVKDYNYDLKSFLQALYQEMAAIGSFLHTEGYAVQTIYIGGGTPTVLSEEDMAKLLDNLVGWFVSSSTAEITVEAGRPDTLSLSKLKMLKEAGINRICINPQTMNDATLAHIGRRHNRKGVVQSVEWARQAGIQQINMDLIVGLPGEGYQEHTNTAEEILKLKPENITVHTLAIKRGSLMAETSGKEHDALQVRGVEEGVQFFAATLGENGYLPYYLYRQKYMKANLENVGYGLPHKFCLYNIQMMEERQTIIGLGGGAASKFINPLNWTLSSFYNPKNPTAYCHSIDRLIARKVDNLRALN